MKFKIKMNDKKIESSYKDFLKIFNMPNINTNKHKNRKIDDIRNFPANGHDRCNYAARYGISDFQIQALLKFNERLDLDKLKRAVRLSVDEEPVFGCRFIETDTPYWKRLDNLDTIRFCSYEETDSFEESTKRFFESPLDMDKDPMVKLRLIRSDDCDILVIKINHSCCDAGGVKEYIRLLSEIYSRIDAGNEYIPSPRIAGRRDQDKLLGRLGIKGLLEGWTPALKTSKTLWTLPMNLNHSDSTRMVISNLPTGAIDKLHEYSIEKGATINDLILTAYFRAMFETAQPMYGIPLEIEVTVDLRRYLHDRKTAAIRNLSGGVHAILTRIMDEPFDKTLSRVSHEMNELKNGYPGLQNILAAEYVEKSSFKGFVSYFQNLSQVSKNTSQSLFYSSGSCFPVLSNLGFVSDSLLKFGENAVTDAYILPPTANSPGFLLMTSTYNGVLTISAGYYKGSMRHKDVEKLINRIKNELISICN